MKSRRIIRLLLPIFVILALGFSVLGAVQAQTPRPILVLQYYTLSENPVTTGNTFTLSGALFNTGDAPAKNVVVVFESTNCLPVGTGGVLAVQEILISNHFVFSQNFVVSADAWASSYATITMRVSYTTGTGESYNETFAITVGIRQPRWNAPTPTITPSPTVRVLLRPQVVVESYDTGAELQPGTIFNLTLDLVNLGNSDAKSMTLVLGGGSIPNDQGTPSPGGFSGSGDLSNFAPLGTSNLIYLGDIAQGGTMQTSPQMIVNVTTQPGAYPFKLSFIYLDERGNRIQDDQVITLLVFKLPQVEINFYRAPDIYFSGQMGVLPIQVTNLGRTSVVLGNLVVTSNGADISNNISLVGALEPGGFFTLDASVMPYQSGSLDIIAEINYTDDFNQPRTVTQLLTINVEDGSYIEPTPEVPIDDGSNPPVVVDNESIGDKAWRFLLGLLGLDSAPPQAQPVIPVDGGTNGGDINPLDPGGKGIPIDSGGKGIP